MLLPECALKLRPLDGLGRNDAPGDIQIQVTREDKRCVHLVLAGIFKTFLELGATQIVIPSTFKVQIVGHQRSLPVNKYVAHQSHTSANSPLEWMNRGDEPTWTPKV
jgi:hypothetical protein